MNYQTHKSSQSFGQPHLITQSIDSLPEIKIMHLIKSLKSILHFLLALHNSAFRSYSFFTILTCVLVFDYVFDAFAAVWGKLCSLWTYRLSCHWTHLWWLYSWNVVWLWGRLCHLSLGSWSWCVTWRLSLFISVLFTNHVLHRFWVLVFWARISHFSFTVSVAAFSHSTLVVSAIFWLNKFPRFILFKRPIHWFYSWDIIFHNQCLLSDIWAFQ